MVKTFMLFILLTSSCYAMKYRYGNTVRIKNSEFRKNTNLKFYKCANDAKIIFYYYTNDKLYYKMEFRCNIGGITDNVLEKNIIKIKE